MKHELVLLSALVSFLLAPALRAQDQPSLDAALAAFRAGRYAEAASVCEALIKEKPDVPGFHFWRGRALLEQGRVEEAIREFRVVLKTKSDSVETLYWLGAALKKSGDLEGARQAWEQALAVRPGYVEAKQALAELKGETATGQGPAAQSQASPTPKSPRAAKGAPPSHHRVRVDLAKIGDIGDVSVTARNFLDYTFSVAPTDWYVAGGQWGTTNRWTCQPQWSWFGGFAELAPTVIWNKKVFVGDITVDAYGCFGMLANYPRSYKNPADLNITLCGDGSDLGSGYAFIVGGWQNTRTAIVKQGKILAETTDPACLMPVFEDQTWGGYEFHRKWWGIRARKVGNLLQLYVDEKLACEARDPSPLPGGRVAIWGYDNRIILARVGIWYEALAQPQPPLPAEKWTVRTQLAAESPKPPPADASMTAANLPPPRLSVPAVIANDFEYTVEPLQPRSLGFAKVALASPGAEGSARCLKIINTGPGGCFGVDLATKPFDVGQLPILEFDYRVGPDVKVNLYAQVNDRTYEIVFTGRQDGAGLADLAGCIENVQADGQWHHARVDLGGLLRQAAKAWGVDTLQVTALWFGNLNERDYLGAGFGGNAAGASWALDNLRLYGPVTKLVIAAPRPPAGKNIKGVAWQVDQSPTSQPPREAAQAPADKEVTANKSGWWYVHAACQLDDGTWLAAAHAPVAIDVDAPTASLVSPGPGSVAGDEDIVVAVSDPPFNAINWRSVQLTIASKTVQLGQPGVTLDPAANRIVVEPGLAGLSFEPGKPVQVQVAALRDVAGNALSAPLSWTFTYSPEKDKRAPRLAALSLGRKYLADADFETEIGGMESYSGGGGAFLALDRSKAASGKSSLRLTNPSEMGRFGVRLVNQPFDAGVYRLVSLDYCIPPHYRGDFAVYVNGDWKGIRFTDTDNPIGYIGRIEDVRADGKWHHLEFNLYDMLVADDPTAPAYRVDWFVLSDWGPITANFRRREIWLDNFQIAPVVSGLEPIKASVVATDPGGISGVAWVLDVLSTATLPKQPNADRLEFDVPPQPSGLYWFRVRAFDGAGNASGELSRRFLVDAERPQALAAGPAEGQRAAESEIQLVLDDRGPAGIDPASVVLKVADREYRCDRAGLTYNAATRRLIWNCEKVTPQPVVFADGQRIEVKLVSAADYAGNRVEQLPVWSWIMDYSLDRRPPIIAELDSPTHRTWVTQTFEEGLEGWTNRGGSDGAKVELDTSTAASGRACVKLTQQTQGGSMQAALNIPPFQAEAYPLVSFDYNFQPGVHLDLLVWCNGSYYPIAMTDDPAGAIGRVPGMVADGQWHHVTFDLFGTLRRVIREGSLTVSYIIVTDRNNADNPVGAVARFDNFVIGRPGTGPIQMTWRATDTTGIKAYSYVCDRDAATEPDTTPETQEQAANLGTRDNGIWYFHLRAQDGAGNWGPARHYAILNGSIG